VAAFDVVGERGVEFGVDAVVAFEVVDDAFRDGDESTALTRCSAGDGWSSMRSCWRSGESLLTRVPAARRSVHEQPNRFSTKSGVGRTSD
jgi:hypothetical protein